MSKLILLLLVLSASSAFAGGKSNIGAFQVRETPGTQTTNTLFEVNSTTRAAIPAPKMTSTQRDAISSPSAGMMVFNTSTNAYNLYNGTAWVAVGSATGGINYIANPDFEAGTTGWATYADAAATSPVDGTGGSPNVTLTKSTSSPLRDTASGLVTKDAANRQGQGISYDFTIASADEAQPLTISFEYNPSANFVAGTGASSLSDLVVYVYDVTNSTLIQPAPFVLAGGATSNQKFSSTFQTASNSTSYRLIFHIAGTGTSAWTLKLDTVSVGPQSRLYGVPATDWQSFTMSVKGSTSDPTKSNSPTTDAAYWRRVGDSMEIVYSFVASTTVGAAAGSGSYLYQIPNGNQIDTNKLTTSASQNIGVVGSAMIGTSTLNLWGSVKAYSSTALAVEIGNDTTSKGTQGSALYPFTTTSLIVSFRAVVPISGWGGNVQMSQDADTRVVAAKYSTTSTAALSNGTVLPQTTSIFDTHAALNGSGVFTCPVAGKYRITGAFATSSTAASGASDFFGLIVYKNGSVVSGGADLASHYAVSTSAYRKSAIGSTMLDCNAGDTLEARESVSAVNGHTLSGSADLNWVSFERLSGPATVAASETVSARYTGTGTANLTGSDTQVNFDTKDYDSHGAVTTGASWKFTAPISGKYRVSAGIGTSNTAATSAASHFTLSLYKNGSIYEILDDRIAASTSGYRKFLAGSREINLQAGDFIDVRVATGDATTHSLAAFATSQSQSVEIIRTGN